MLNTQIGFVLLFSLLVVACSATPERADGNAYSEGLYEKDDMECMLEVRKKYPNIRRLAERGGNIPTGKMSMGYMDYRNCMTNKGWKNF